MLQSAFLGGLFNGILSALPIINLGNCCCLWIGGGGGLAAYLAQQEAPRPFTPVQGAKAGLLAGVIGAFVFAIVSFLVDTMMAPLQERMLGDVLSSASDLPPEVRGWFEMMRSREAMPFRFALGFLFQLFAGAIFSTLGGLLAATFFRRDGVPPAMGGDAVVPPPIPPPGPPPQNP
jgi:hypothetical protein